MTSGRRLNIEDQAQLRAYLRGRALISRAETPAFQALRGGVSNRTVWVGRGEGEDWVLKQALAKLRVQVDWFSDPKRIQREAAALRWLARIIPGHVPRFVFHDDEQNILAMSAIPQPHCNWKTALLNGQAEPRFARLFGRLLAKIHGAAQQHPALAQEFAERRFFEELRLEPYYGYTAAQVPAAASFLARLIEATRARRHALVHGDYSPKNVLIQRETLIILDYEVIHFGDPAFDIGFSLTHFLSKAHHLPARREALLELARQYWRSYRCELTPQLREIVGQFAAQHTVACLLARVAGRSPLEYLAEFERARQRHIALKLMKDDISDVSDLIEAVSAELRHFNE